MRQNSIFTLLLVMLMQPAFAQELRPVTHEDVWTMNRLGSPVVSPDGELAVVSVTEPSYEEDGDVSDLWLIRVDGSAEPRRLTATREGESGIAWRPDGGAIVFTAKRGESETNQVYLLDMTGPGEAQQITGLSTGAANPDWSPDGKKIAFESKVYPGKLDDEANKTEKEAREERDYNVTAYDIFPIRQWDHWRDDRQVHLFVQDAVADAQAVDLLAGSALVDRPGFSGTPSRSGNGLKAAWTPDGAGLVFNATVNLDEAAHSEVMYHLYRVDLEGGEPRALTGGADWSCTGPKFPGNGKQLYCEINAANEFVYNLSEVGRFDWTGSGELGQPAVITEGFDRSVNDFELSENGRTVYLTAADAGRTRIYQLPSKGGEVTALNPESRGVYGGLQVAGKNLVARWESSAIPAEIVRVDRNGKNTALSSFNAERVKGLDRPAFREFWFESSKGRRIHSLLALPCLLYTSDAAHELT